MKRGRKIRVGSPLFTIFFRFDRVLHTANWKGVKTYFKAIADLIPWSLLSHHKKGQVSTSDNFWN